MKKVLCFGDSNVFGFNPKNATRYDKNIRWSGVLQILTAGICDITEAGCNNRTAFSINPAGKIMTGHKILPELLTTDFDIVIIAIGINDLQFTYNTKIEDYKDGVQNLINITKQKLPNSQIILLSPSVISQNIMNSFFANLFDKNSVEKSKHITPIYKELALKNNCKFLDLNQIAQTSEIDGLHYNESEHNKIAQAVFGIIKTII